MRWPNHFKVNNNYPKESSRGKIWSLVSVKNRGKKTEYAVYQDENEKTTKLKKVDFLIVSNLIECLETLPSPLEKEIEALKSIGYPYG